MRAYLKPILLSTLLTVVMPLSSSISHAAAQTCADLFAAKPLAAPRDAADEVIAALDKKLPGQTEINDEMTVIRRFDPLTGKDLGYIRFRFRTSYSRDPYLDIDHIEVSPRMRKKGLSKLMLALLIKKLPPFNEIYSDGLVDSNEAAFIEASARGLSKIDAMKETPAYRLRRSLGFGKIEPTMSGFNIGNLSLGVRADIPYASEDLAH